MLVAEGVDEPATLRANFAAVGDDKGNEGGLGKARPPLEKGNGRIKKGPKVGVLASGGLGDPRGWGGAYPPTNAALLVGPALKLPGALVQADPSSVMDADDINPLF
jgi:hypothetical protein